MKRLFVLTAALVALPTAANAATIVNGSFETGVNPGAFTTLTASTASAANITGWLVTGGSVDYIGNYWQAAGGSARSVDLAGLAIGTLSQTITTVIGQAYRLSYFLSANPDGPFYPRDGLVQATGNAAQALSFPPPPTTRTNMRWTEFTYDFTATGALTTIDFMASAPSAGGPAGLAYGPALDDVSIAAVPEPATWALLLGGFGAIGSVMRRRRNLRVSFS